MTQNQSLYWKIYNFYKWRRTPIIFDIPKLDSENWLRNLNQISQFRTTTNSTAVKFGQQHVFVMPGNIASHIDCQMRRNIKLMCIVPEAIVRKEFLNKLIHIYLVKQKYKDGLLTLIVKPF